MWRLVLCFAVLICASCARQERASACNSSEPCRQAYADCKFEAVKATANLNIPGDTFGLVLQSRQDDVFKACMRARNFAQF